MMTAHKAASPWKYPYTPHLRKPWRGAQLVVVDGRGEFSEGATFDYYNLKCGAAGRVWPDGMTWRNKSSGAVWRYEMTRGRNGRTTGCLRRVRARKK